MIQLAQSIPIAACLALAGDPARTQDANPAPAHTPPRGRAAELGFFFPEIDSYREQCKVAKVADVGAYLRKLSGLAHPDSEIDAATTRLLRAALFVAAADRVGGLTKPILAILGRSQDRRLHAAAECALVSTLRDRERLSELDSGLSDDAPERLRITCIRVAARVRPRAVRSRMRALLKHRSAATRLAVAIALAEAGDGIALRALLRLLTDDELSIRHGAATTLRRWTGKDVGYSATSPKNERAAAIQRWWTGLETLDTTTLAALPPNRHEHVLAVCGKQLLELGPSGKVLHEQGGFVSLSEATELKGGHRLVTDFMGQSLVEFDRKWKEVRRVNTPFQPRGAHRLPGGRTLVVGMGAIVVFDANEKKLSEQRFPRANFTGTALIGCNRFLATCNDIGSVWELTVAGKVRRRIKAGRAPRSVQTLDDGRLLVADFRHAAIYTPEGEMQWRYALDGVRSAHRLPSGNILLGHPAGLSVVNLEGDVLWKLDRPAKGGYGYYAQLAR